MMRLTNRYLLKNIWRAAGQLRLPEPEPPKKFDGGVVAPFKNGASAAASISADFELAWAWRNLTPAAREEKARIERANVPFIVSALQDLNVPITWATVGHMFLDRCVRGGDGRAHPEMPRPPKNPRGGDWYESDPCQSLKEASGWYAPDLIRQILQSPAGHELGTHSFSHIDFSPETSTPELVEKEMEACAGAMAPFGVKPRSLVFCFNHMGYQHLDLLFRSGITAVRHRDENIRLGYPERTSSGIYKICESMNLRLARRYNYVDKARVFIEEAIERGTAYHLWFHPSDDRKVFEQSFVPIVAYLASRRAHIWICTMGQLAAYCEARRSTVVTTRRTAQAISVELSGDFDARQYGDTDITLCLDCPKLPSSVRVCDPARTLNLDPQNYRFDSGRKILTINAPCAKSSIEICFGES